MSKKFLICLWLLTFFVLNSCVTDIVIEEDDHSLILTDSNWDHAHSLYDYMFVFFYRPDCDECVLNDEIFVYAAKHAKEADHEVKFGFVNISQEKAIAAQEQIEKVPMMKFYHNKTGVHYLRTIGKTEIVEWLTGRVNYKLQSISTVKDAKDLLIQNRLVVIGCILSNILDDVRDFEVIATLHDDVEFRLVTDAELCQEFNLPINVNSLGIYQYEFDIQHTVSGKLTRKIMNDFIVRHHVPIYSEFSEFIFTKSFVGHYHYFIAIVFKTLPIALTQLKAEIRSIAKELDGKAIFILFDTSKEKVRRFLEHLSIPREDGFRVIESNEHLVNYKPDQPLNLNASYMLAYIKNVMNGLEDSDLMGSEPKENWHLEPIKHLTKKTYDEFVMDKSKHVFVILYSPQCRFSRDALTLFDKLAEIYKDDSDVALAKLDATIDELPRIKVTGTPMFFLYLKGTNERIKFVGERSVENVKKFLESNGKHGNEPQYLEVDHLQHARLTEKGLVHDDL